jgi:hypothetical protein
MFLACWRHIVIRFELFGTHDFSIRCDNSLNLQGLWCLVSTKDQYTDGFSIQHDVEAGHEVRGLQGPHPTPRGCEARISGPIRASLGGEIPQRLRHSIGQGKGRTRCVGSEGQRPHSVRANKDHKGVDLTQRQADELAGDWYRWFASQHLDNPGDAKRWSALREVLWDMAETAGDPELREADFNDPEALGVTETEAKASQFLIDRGIALTPAGRTRFLSALVREFLAATKTLERRARGDWGPDQHLEQLAPSPNLAPVMASPSSNGQHRSAVTGGQAQLPSAVEIFEASCEGRALKPSTIMNQRTVFVTLDKEDWRTPAG